MRRVFRVVSALGAGAALVWGLAKSLRGKGKSQEGEKAAEWPPKPADAEKSEPVARPVPVAVPDPEPDPEPAPAVAEELVLKGVVIDDPSALVAYVNGASEDELQASGVKGKALSVVLDNRPFASAEALGSTAGIGRRTLQTLCNAVD